MEPNQDKQNQAGEVVEGSSGNGFIQADAPIAHRSQDRLNRARIADAIADQVIYGPKGHGIVIGVAGKWGSGKTSVLRMSEEAVTERSNAVVVNFNPWLFSGTEELVSRFLLELAAQLRALAQDSTSGTLLRNAGDALSKYAETVEPFGWLPVVGPWLSRVGGVGRAYQAIRKQQQELPSAEAQRQKVRADLAKLDRRVLVIIDDLDRIEEPQVRDMVRLVKLVGDFPNTTYLVAYDRGPVERALGSSPEEGRLYLEKIIQVVHDIPEPPQEALAELLVEELATVTESIDHGPFRVADWQNVFPDGIRPFFRSARDVRRYLNAIPVTLRVLGGEVALVDVLALEAIRIFAPEAYAELPASIGTLAGRRRTFGEDSQRRDAVDAPRVEAILAGAGAHREATTEILQQLFPNVGHLTGGSRITGGEQTARKDLRVADPEVLRTYLERSLPAGAVSGVLVGQAFAALGDPVTLSLLFSELTPDVAEGLIKRLEDFEHDFDPSVVEPAVPVLLDQLPRLRPGRRHGLFDFGSDVVVARVVLRLLRAIGDDAERLAVVERCLPAVETLYGRMELLDVAGHRKNVGSRLIPESDSERLYSQLHDQVAGADPEILSAERGVFDLFLRLFQDRGPDALEAIRSLTQHNDVLLALLRSAIREQTSQTVGEYAVRQRAALPWDLLQEWLGVENLSRRLIELSESVTREDLDERTAVALETAEGYASGRLDNKRDDDF